METVPAYRADDGTLHATAEACSKHNAACRAIKENEEILAAFYTEVTYRGNIANQLKRNWPKIREVMKKYGYN